MCRRDPLGREIENQQILVDDGAPMPPHVENSTMLFSTCIEYPDRMAASKKLQRYCRIFQWVEEKDANLARAIRDLCMEGALSGGRHGVTFLFPAEPVREQIIKLAYSKDPEQAVQILEAHIIPGSVRTSDEFRKEIGTLRGVKLEAETAKASTVTLKGGATLKIASDFNPLRKDNISVWVVESGAVPLEGPEYVVPSRGRKGTKKPGAEAPRARGGADKETTMLSSRATLAVEVETAFDQCMRTDRCRTQDPYLSHTVSLLNFLQGSHPDLLITVLPIIDRDPVVSFYLLVEPYKEAPSDFLIPDNVLFGPSGWNAAKIYEGAVSEFEGFFELLGQQIAPSAQDPVTAEPVVPYVFKDVEYVRSAIDTVRLNIIGDDGGRANKVKTPKQVREAYEILISQNTIASVCPILPNATIRALPGTKKLWQDELRFILHTGLKEIREWPVYEKDKFADLIRQLRFHWRGDHYSKESALSNFKDLENNVDPRAEFDLLVKFISSSDFLYVPVPSEKITGGWGEIPVTSEDKALYNPNEMDVYNAEVDKQALLRKYKNAGVDTPQRLDQGTIAAVRHYYLRHKELPSGIME